jgi:transcriptional regulator with XRE-family HTH domain
VNEPVPPARALERLGRQLRGLRLKAGLSGEELAERIGTNQSRVSRTELAKFRASLDMVRKWLDVTGASEAERQELLEMAEQSLVEMESYRYIFRGSLDTGQQIALQQEDVSARIRHFQPFMIPGLLQTPAYARAVLTAGRVADETGLDEAVATRMKRGERIREPGAAAYHVVLMEQALRWQPLGITPADRVDAWRQVIDVATVDHITLQVIPLDTATAKTPLCGFVITEFRPESGESPIAQVELPAVDMTFHGEKDLAEFELLWRAMLDAALGPQESAKYLRRLLRGQSR